VRWVVAFALLSLPAVAADWISIKSQRVEVLTDAGEHTGRDLLARFETIRNIFQDVALADDPLPVRAIAFSSEREFHDYHDDRLVEGFQTRGDRDYIAMFVGPEARRVATHEYVHVVLNHARCSLPIWFEEGLAEFYSNADVRDTKITVGERIDGRLASLTSTAWLSASELSSRDRAITRRPIFYAESWALVHMLNLSPRWRDGMPQFVLALAENRDGFQSAFGKSMDQALMELHSYIQSMPTFSLAHRPPASSGQYAVAKLSPIAAAVARAELALHVDRPALARSLIEKAAGTLDTAEVSAARGEIELADKHPEKARVYFKRAIELGSRDPEMWFQYANLEHDHALLKNDLLQKVVELNPDFAEAHFLLGERLTDAGDFTRAIAHLQEAVRVRPRDSFYWHALGFAQVKAGLQTDAIASARHAKATAITDPQESAADALIQLAQQQRQPIEKRPPVTTPPSWQNPKGDTRVEGVLTQVDCDPDLARLHVADAAGKAITLSVLHPDRVTLVNAPGLQHAFPCGPQKLAVAVEYFGTTSEVTKIEFRTGN
jgi:tetratricopeptide (TPR) repeat protein